MSNDYERRHSKAEPAELITNSIELAEQEAKNALRQYDYGMSVVEEFVTHTDRPFRLRPSLLYALHREALAGLSSYAGNHRPGSVTIEKSNHEPVPAHLVPVELENMCDYVNDHWDDSTAFHLSAYLMWRLNWIHPFSDGNGRTSRIVSYVVLSIRANMVMPGTPTIPEQIVYNRKPYFDALEAADAAAKDDRIDVSEMEELLRNLLANQLYSIIETADGGDFSELLDRR